MAKTNEKGLETLQVWQRAVAFATEICRNTLPRFPAHEKWSLTDQLRRSAQSVPANIAEGYGRYSFQESVRFCYIARGSLEETFSHLVLAHRLGYLNDETFKKLNEQIQDLKRMLNGYISFLKASKRGASEPGANHFTREEPALYLADLDLPLP
ncbi:MAG TPA: four helix bundle protein [Anaerolineales bacterium]|jgi:four helix bundle protein